MQDAGSAALLVIIAWRFSPDIHYEKIKYKSRAEAAIGSSKYSAVRSLDFVVVHET